MQLRLKLEAVRQSALAYSAEATAVTAGGVVGAGGATNMPPKAVLYAMLSARIKVPMMCPSEFHLVWIAVELLL